MALSGLLVSGTKLRLHPKGFPTPTRCFSSSSSANSTNTANNESIKTHSEDLRKDKHLQNEVEKPFYLLKAFNKLKEKVLSSALIGKALTSEALDTKEDRISANTSEVIKTEKLDTVEPVEALSTDSKNHKSEIGTSPTSDIISNEPSGDSVSPPDSSEYGGLPPNKKSVTEVLPNSDSFEKPSWLVDLLDDDKPKYGSKKLEVKDFVDHIKQYHKDTLQFSDDDITNLAKINTLNNGHHSRDGNEAVETNRTLKRLDQVKRKLPISELLEYQVQQESQMMQRRKERSASEMLSTKSDDSVPFNNGYRSRDRNEAAVTKKTLKRPDQVRKNPLMSELFRQRADNHVQEESQMERRKERSVSEMLSTKLDDSLPSDDTDSLHSDDDKTNMISLAAMTARILNEHENVSESDDAALDCEMSKPNPPVSLNSRIKKALEDGSKSDDAALDCKMSESNPTTPMDSGIKNPHDNGSKSDDAASDCRMSKPTPQIPLSSQNKPSERGRNSLLFTQKDISLTYVLIRFVPQARSETDIQRAFEDCGPIEEIHFIASDKERIFKNAYVRFKTKEGMRRALSKTDALLRGAAVVVEAASPSTYTSLKVHPPNLIGIHGVPPSLVKNPTRTVMVTGLTCNVASRHLEEAFSFCGACITGFFMGSSSSVAYVEFETEFAKEKAIEACFVHVSGSKLSILRIDTPCTTVVRIINNGHNPMISDICRKYGKLRRVFNRSAEVTDIHYDISEWPAMVDILNSLNGLVVDGRQWSAMPAPVIPVEILRSLWRQPDGRRQVLFVFQNTCRKLEETSMPEVKDAVTQYFEEAIKTFQS